MSSAIEVQGVSKRFRLYQEKYTSLKERIIHAGRVPYHDFWALRDIELKVDQGETLGILGRNGCGKSTLLKCIAGVLKPTAGEIRIRGHLAAMLELGAGFQPELSGRDNIYLNASLLGMSRRSIDRAFDDIVAFAELEEFIDNQVRFYSSGMYVRLGFAVAVNVDPDVLLVDEVLAVGDERFQQKCMERISRFQHEGRTIVVVSHAADTMRQLCTRVAVMNAGQLVTVAPPGEAIRAFRDVLIETGEATGAIPAVDVEDGASAPVPEPHARRVKTLGARLETAHPERVNLRPGESATVVVDLEVHEALPGVVFGCTVWNQQGSRIFEYESGDPVPLPAGRSSIALHFESLPLLDGSYSVNVRVREPGGGTDYAGMEPAVVMTVENPGTSTGLVALPLTVELSSEAGPGEVHGPLTDQLSK
jgi:ABC-2 type transport system ATP-binding protein